VINFQQVKMYKNYSLFPQFVSRMLNNYNVLTVYYVNCSTFFSLVYKRSHY